MASRGIGLDDVDSFLDPRLRNLLPDPFVLKDMEKACIRLADAAMKGEVVAIAGDYDDVDGASSSALLKLLDEVGGKTFIHIPERDDGYGPGPEMML